MHHHHRGGPGSGLPVAPPPPLLSSRSRGSGPRSSGRSRSRSRSRSPRSTSKYHGGGGRGDRDSRDLRDRVDRERERDRERRRSVSPYGSGSRSERDRDRERDSRAKTGASSTAKSASSLEALPSISLIQSENAIPRSIIRSILNPEDVRIPRRVNEGAKPIFEREELREAMVRRMRANDNEENPPQTNVYIQEPAVTQQRVVAIIREPVGADLYLASKDPAFHALVGSSAKVSSVSAGAPSILQRLSPEPHNLRAYRRSVSPSNPRSVRQTGRPSPVPPAPQLSRPRSTERERERERERIILDRERDREQIQRAMEREREQLGRGNIRGERDRERILHPERERDLLHEIRGGDRDRDRQRERDLERDSREKSRFGGGSMDRMDPHRTRSRSPVSRVPREDLRMRRRSRSHSVTPPPMPEEIRRQLIERQRNIDLRNSLSRRPAKFLVEHEERAKGERGGPPTRGGMGRGRGGGFPNRSGRGREEGRVWVHDMYDGDDEPKKGN